MGKKLQKSILFIVFILFCFQHNGVAFASEPEWKQVTWDTEQDELGQCVWGNDEYIYVGGLHTDNNSITRSVLLKYDKNGESIWYALGFYPNKSSMNSSLSLWADNEYAYLLGTYNNYNSLYNKTYLRTNLNQQTAENEHGFSAYWFLREEFLFDVMGYEPEDRYYTVGYITNSSQENPNINLTLVKWHDAYMGVSPNPTSQWNLWACEFDENQDEIGYDLWVDNTGIYTLGYTEDQFGNQKMLLMQWFFSGGMKWKREWSVPSYNIIGKSITAKDGYLYTLGTSQSNSSTETDLVLIAWDGNGNEVWNSTWGGSEPEIAESIWNIQNSIYCVGHTNGRVFMVEFNLKGEFVCNHTVPEVYHYSDYNRIWGDDNCLYITGYSVAPQGDFDLELLQFYTEGIQRIPGYSSFLLVGIVSIYVILLMIPFSLKIKSK